MIATKEQERKALQKIKKIVEGLGEDSYVAQAFDGVFEIAEQNIEYGAADSVRYSIQFREREIDDLKKSAKKLEDRIAELEEEIQGEQNLKKYWINECENSRLAEKTLELCEQLVKDQIGELKAALCAAERAVIDEVVEEDWKESESLHDTIEDVKELQADVEAYTNVLKELERVQEGGYYTQPIAADE